VVNADLDVTAVADQKFNDQVTSYSYEGTLSDRIELTDYEPNRLTYRSSSATERLAVFSEIYYPEGWIATIDGEAANHIRVDYLLRGMIIPAGEHEVVFEFRPRSYYGGEKVALAGSITLILLLLGAMYMEMKKVQADQ